MSWYPELIFRNNVVRNNRARSILVSTPRKVVVEGNTFSSMMSAILFEGTWTTGTNREPCAT